MGKQQRLVPLWSVAYLLIVSVIAIYDMLYVWLWPMTSKDGALGAIYVAHAAYSQVDTLFANPTGVMVRIITLPFGTVEVVFNVLASMLTLRGLPAAPTVSLVAHTYIVAKTLIYIAYDVKYINFSNLGKVFSLFILPNSLWVVTPALACWQISGRLTEVVDREQQRGKVE